MRNVIIVGSQGQDGQLLYERLATEGCALLGIDRDGVRTNTRVVDAAAASVDVLDRTSVDRLVQAFAPDAVFYLAAFHHSSEDACPFDDAELYLHSHDVHVRGPSNFLETLRRHVPRARFFYAASSHCFGEPSTTLQDESTPLRPVCPYGISKTAGVHLCRMYRARHGVQASCGFLYNHESPLRPGNFLSAKIVRGAVEIARRQRDRLILGDLSARVDWGYAPDYIDAMIRMVRLDAADDFVVASGRAHSVEDFVSIAFAHLELHWRRHVDTDASLLTKARPGAPLMGDSSKLRRTTGWAPSVSFADMVRLLVEAELSRTAGAVHSAQ
jgi:GDPmannose 4,6-dehydratase